MTYDFDYWRAKYALEAFKALEEKWSAVIKSTDDDDIQSDYSMDLIKLDMLRESFEREAIEAFGKRVTSFSRRLLMDVPIEELGGACIEESNDEHHVG